MENKKYHASGTVSKSNNEKQKNTTLPEQFDCSGSVVFFCFSLLDFETVLEVWYFFVCHYWILRLFWKCGIFLFFIIGF
jgi:hypothetical protein